MTQQRCEKRWGAKQRKVSAPDIILGTPLARVNDIEKLQGRVFEVEGRPHRERIRGARGLVEERCEVCSRSS